MKKKIGLVFGLILLITLFMVVVYGAIDEILEGRQRKTISKGLVAGFERNGKNQEIQIKFFAVDKKEYVIQRGGFLGISNIYLQVGDSVEVIYNSKYPEEGTVNLFEYVYGIWFLIPLVLSIFFAFFYSLVKEIKETFNMTEAQRVQVERQEELDKEMREFIKQELIKAEEKQFLTKSNIVRILLFGLFFPLMLYRFVHSISDFILFYLAGILIDALLIWAYYSTKKQ